MADSSGSKPFMVTSSINLKVTTPSFYNQPKKFASVNPPRPKSQSDPWPPPGSTPPAGPSPPPSLVSSTRGVGTAVIGRVGVMPPPPPSLCEDFPPPPPPMDDELPAPPPNCATTPPASDAPPPAFPPPPAVDDLPLPPAPPEENACLPRSPSPPPPPPPPPLPVSGPSSVPSAGENSQCLEKQTSFDKQLGSLTDLLSEMETRGPFNPKLPSQYSAPPPPAPKPAGPPPTAPKPNLSFLPPPEMGDKPPPAPWAEELKLRTTHRQANNPISAPAPAPAPQPFAKAPVGASKAFGGMKTGTSMPPVGLKNQNHAPAPFGVAPKLSPAASSFSPPPAAPPAPPANKVAPPAFNHSKPSSIDSQMTVSLPPPAPVPPPQPKAMTPPPSSYSQPMKSPPSSKPSPPGPVSVPGGGVPLSMREVEELERMTNAFIKDMDTHAPVITSAPTEVCGKCGEALSRSQPAVRAMNKLFHSDCFCCMSCHRPLQGMQFYDKDGTPQCDDCYTVSTHMYTHSNYMHKQLIVIHSLSHTQTCTVLALPPSCLCVSTEFSGGVFSVWGAYYRPCVEGGGPVFPCPLFPLLHLRLQPGGGALHHRRRQQPILCPRLPQAFLSPVCEL
uniref:Zyxin n=1 Tax=Oncorhynchus mykiss TaxID=8022 RepID=A0A8K9WRK7_ONCMY